MNGKAPTRNFWPNRRPKRPGKLGGGLLLLGLAWLLTACSGQNRTILPTLAATIAPPVIERIEETAESPPQPDSRLPATFTPEPQLLETASPAPTVVPCREPGQLQAGLFPSSVAGPQRRYLIYLPPCYENSRLYPTLYLLHGNGQNENKWPQLGVVDWANEEMAAGRLPPALLIMPDGGSIAYNSFGGNNSFETIIVEELVPFIEENYCAWPDRRGRAIGGLSRGGYWSLEIAFRHPLVFGAVGGHSASLLEDRGGPEINPRDSAAAHPPGDLRIYLDIGRFDIGLPYLEQLHEDLAAEGITHDWHLNEGGHDDAYWQSQLADYLSWYAANWPKTRRQYPPC